MRSQVADVLKSVDDRITFHDFRMVNGKNQINLIFDIVVPLTMTKKTRRASEKNPQRHFTAGPALSVRHHLRQRYIRQVPDSLPEVIFSIYNICTAVICFVSAGNYYFVFRLASVPTLFSVFGCLLRSCSLLRSCGFLFGRLLCSGFFRSRLFLYPLIFLLPLLISISRLRRLYAEVLSFPTAFGGSSSSKASILSPFRLPLQLCYFLHFFAVFPYIFVLVAVLVSFMDAVFVFVGGFCCRVLSLSLSLFVVFPYIFAISFASRAASFATLLLFLSLLQPFQPSYNIHIVLAA